MFLFWKTLTSLITVSLTNLQRLHRHGLFAPCALEPFWLLQLCSQTQEPQLACNGELAAALSESSHRHSPLPQAFQAARVTQDRVTRICQRSAWRHQDLGQQCPAGSLYECYKHALKVGNAFPQSGSFIDVFFVQAFAQAAMERWAPRGPLARHFFSFPCGGGHHSKHVPWFWMAIVEPGRCGSFAKLAPKWPSQRSGLHHSQHRQEIERAIKGAVHLPVYKGAASAREYAGAQACLPEPSEDSFADKNEFVREPHGQWSPNLQLLARTF